MESFEIDAIEVADSKMEVTYWIPGQNDLQSIIFKTKDFEKWLIQQRNISMDAYWDHWDSNNEEDQLSYQIAIDDIAQYLNYRIGMFRHKAEKPTVSLADIKPMTRVTQKGMSQKGKSA
jgi:hypothetical protein